MNFRSVNNSEALKSCGIPKTAKIRSHSERLTPPAPPLTARRMLEEVLLPASTAQLMHDIVHQAQIEGEKEWALEALRVADRDARKEAREEELKAREKAAGAIAHAAMRKFRVAAAVALAVAKREAKAAEAQEQEARERRARQAAAVARARAIRHAKERMDDNARLMALAEEARAAEVAKAAEETRAAEAAEARAAEAAKAAEEARLEAAAREEEARLAEKLRLAMEVKEAKRAEEQAAEEVAEEAAAEAAKAVTEVAAEVQVAAAVATAAAATAAAASGQTYEGGEQVQNSDGAAARSGRFRGTSVASRAPMTHWLSTPPVPSRMRLGPQPPRSSASNKVADAAAPLAGEEAGQSRARSAPQLRHGRDGGHLGDDGGERPPLHLRDSSHLPRA